MKHRLRSPLLTIDSPRSDFLEAKSAERSGAAGIAVVLELQESNRHLTRSLDPVQTASDRHRPS